MTANQFDTSAILNLLSAIAALSAVVLAIASEKRAQKRFQESIGIQERLAAANVRPILTVHSITNRDKREIILTNKGLGTAMSVDPTFTKEAHQSKMDVAAVLSMPVSFDYDVILSFVEKEGIHLIAGDSFTLLLLTRECLANQRLASDTIDQIFAAFDDQVRGLTIAISYEDVFGNKQKEYRVTCQ